MAACFLLYSTRQVDVGVVGRIGLVLISDLSPWGSMVAGPRCTKDRHWQDLRNEDPTKERDVQKRSGE